MVTGTRLPLSVHAQGLARTWDLTPHAGLHLAVLLRSSPGLYVTGGSRTPERNKQVGGSVNSWHLKRRAVDLGGPLQSLLDARARVKRQRVTPACTGPEEVLLEYVGTRRQHLHVAW